MANGLWKKILSRVVLIVLCLPLLAWGVLSLKYGSWPPAINVSLAAIFALGGVVSLMLSPLRRARRTFLAFFLLPLTCFFLMRPSSDREWQPDVAEMPYAEINGNQIVLHNVRYCDYQSETNYTVRYETRTYDLSKLKSADILFSDWGLKVIAHTMLSFGFSDGQYLCISIETRKEVGEEYSALKGFFRQFEITYIAADERDVLKLRTNYRVGEDVYLYRIRVKTLGQLRGVFLDYMQRMNGLHEHAEWYNALTDNCMTSGFRILHKHAARGRAELHWSVIANGYADKHAYDTGALDSSLPFDEFKRLSRINDRAIGAGDATDFSMRIREGIPGMDWMPREGDLDDTY